MSTAQASERGSVTVFVSVAALALLLMAGLVVDGGAKVRAIQRADAVAAEAARAAGQAIILPAAVVGDPPRANLVASVRAAEGYLAAEGVAGSVEVEQIDALAAVLARFYRTAERGRLAADDYVLQLRREHAVSRQVIGDFDGSLAESLLAEVQRFLDDNHALLRAQVAGGRVVDGHGDLRPEHVWLDGPPVIIDCLEFDERLRQVDAFDEITYLGLECARLGAAWIGPRLLQRLSAALGHDADPRLLRFYAGYRACVRARLALAHLLDVSPREPERWPPLAREYLRLGTQFSPAPSAR